MQEKLKKIFAKKSVKEKKKIVLTFIDVHMARQKVPKFDSKLFSCAKNQPNTSEFFLLKNLKHFEQIFMKHFI